MEQKEKRKKIEFSFCIKKNGEKFIRENIVMEFSISDYAPESDFNITIMPILTSYTMSYYRFFTIFLFRGWSTENVFSL